MMRAKFPWLLRLLLTAMNLLAISQPTTGAEPAVSAGIFLDHGAAWSMQAGTFVSRGLIARELGRQAFLLAAREEIGLITRDVWLAETAGNVLSVDLTCSPGPSNLLELLTGKPPFQRSVWTREFALKTGPLSYETLLADMELHSRITFHDVLRNQWKQLKAATTTTVPWEPISAERLFAMTAIDQFAVVREAHQARGGDAQKEQERLERLTLGYANLGLLTETYSHPMHAVFKARGLLYAQRAVVRDPQLSRPLVARAYAWLMTGQPAAALRDLVAAETLSKERGETLPEWGSLIRAACRYELTALAARPTNDPLRALSGMMAVVLAGRSGDVDRAKSLMFAQGRELLLPRIYEGSYEVDPQDEELNGFDFAASHFVDRLYPALASTVGLPPEVLARAKQAVRENWDAGSVEELTVRGQIVAALSASADPKSEFSFEILGALIREPTYFHAFHQAQVGKGLEGDAELALQKVLRDHPYRLALNCVRPRFISNDNAQRAEMIRTLLKNLDYECLEWRERGLFDIFPPADQQAFSNCYEIAERHRDLVTRDLYGIFAGRAPDSNIPEVRQLLEVDPFNPAARTRLVLADWEKVKDQAKDWFASGEEHRFLATALNKRLDMILPADQLEQRLQQTAQTAGTFEAFKALAIHYRRQKNNSLWLKTWEQFIERHPEPKDHLWIAIDLTEVLLQDRRPDLAEKFGLLAAEGNASHGRLALATLYEIQQKWDQAEENYRRAAEASPRHASQWYWFCCRTGKGDKKAAQPLAVQHLKEFDDPASANRREGSIRDDLYDPTYAGTLSYSLGKLELAFNNYQMEFTRNQHASAGLLAALVAAELNQNESRDRLLKQVVDRGKPNVSEKNIAPMKELSRRIAADLGTGTPGKIPFDELREIAFDLSRESWHDFFFVLGRHYEQSGNHADSKRAYLESLAQTPVRYHARTLAGIGLLRLGGTPADYQSRWTVPPMNGDQK